jgi:hypothetical protein
MRGETPAQNPPAGQDVPVFHESMSAGKEGQAFFPISPTRIMTTLMPPTVPETPPTIRINSAGSVETDALSDMKKKNPTAKIRKIKPPMTIRQFVRRIAFSFGKRLDIPADFNSNFPIHGR